MGTVKVLGQGEVKFAPDVTRVTVEVDALHGTYQEAFYFDKYDIDKELELLRFLKKKLWGKLYLKDK